LQRQLNNPFDLAFDPAANLLFSAPSINCLRRIEGRHRHHQHDRGTGERGSAAMMACTGAQFNERMA